MPPTINETATTLGSNSTDLMYLWATTPMTAAGRKAMAMAAAKRSDGGSRRSKPCAVVQILAR